MTEIPRRSYPLVVAPPGGFEDAVRRGRTLRRRRTGGSSGLALVLVGALGWGVLGGSSGIDSVREKQDVTADRNDQSAPPTGSGVVTASPQPSATTGASRPGTGPTQGPGSYTGVRPTIDPTSVGLPPTRKPGGNNTPGRRYAKRPTINRDLPVMNTGSSCALSEQEWCAYALADDSAALEGRYTLQYHLCRSRLASDTKVTFPYRQQIEFTATDTKNDDTVWTYSAGQPRINERVEVDVPAGTCVRWSVVWDGLDDFGYTPPQGSYTMAARTFGTTVDLPGAQQTFEHQ